MLNLNLSLFHNYVKINKNNGHVSLEVEPPTISDKWYNDSLQSVGTILSYQVFVAWNPYESTIKVDWLPVIIL